MPNAHRCRARGGLSFFGTNKPCAGAEHLRDVFNRMGFNDQEIVALSGAHCLGFCHDDRSGFSGPWTDTPTEFNNKYFTFLLNKKWVLKKWDGTCPPNARAHTHTHTRERERARAYARAQRGTFLFPLSLRSLSFLLRSPRTLHFLRFRLFLTKSGLSVAGPAQYVDAETETMMMLPTDMALLSTPAFRKHVDVYAADEAGFKTEFARVFGVLMELGVPRS